MLDIVFGIMIGILFLGIILRVIEYRKDRKDRIRELKLRELKSECLEHIYSQDLVGDYDNMDKDDILIYYPGGTIKWDEYEEYKKNKDYHNIIKWEEYMRNKVIYYNHNNMIKWDEYEYYMEKLRKLRNRKC